MKVALYTPLPRFAGELCDVLRLFWPVESFAVSPMATLTGEDALKAQYTATSVTDDMERLTHTFTEETGVWRCTFALRGLSAVREMATGGDAGESDEDERDADGATEADSATQSAQESAGRNATIGANAGITGAGAAKADADANGGGSTSLTALAEAAAHTAALREKRRRKRLCKLTLYDLCVRLSGYRPPWGSLTGIRPTRLVYEKLARGMGLAQAAASLTAQFDVSPEKAELLRRIVAVQQTLPAPRPNEADVYISIPFCRTRCVYCSFPGETLGKGKQVGPYLDALFAEMAQAARMLAEGGFALRALYIGGGTPTALCEEDFAALLNAAGACFPNPTEYTVEAGRPDTITEGKLAAMRSRGVTRVSVNPQTMNDETLLAIGRGHTAADTAEAFRLARRMGFENINMDVIAGLPGEGPAHFARTMAAIEALGPESLTVHTLAIKRASRLHLLGAPLADGGAVTEMVALGEAAALRMGMEPYYLYRQKYMAGQQQNVGYARAGAACLYNIGIMEETASVMACGAGAISKRVFTDRELRIERAPNVSNVGVYVERVSDMVARKRSLFARG
jgi:coproporphyrinogen dehydrogenase HemZ